MNEFISVGYSSHIRIDILFSQVGNIHGKEMINIFDWAMDFIGYSIQSTLSNYPFRYILYLSLFSKLLSDLSAPILKDDEIESLQNRVIEMVCLHEGMFPVSETHMVFHQLIELPSFLRKFGPIRGWWTLPSERGISIVKRNLSKGNYHKFYQRVYKKEFIKEYFQSEEKYSSKQTLFAKDPTIVNEEEEEVSFSDFKTELGDFSDDYECNTFQVKPLIEFMLKELHNKTTTNKILCSPLLRLHCLFKKFYVSKFQDFIQFLEELSEGNISIRQISSDDPTAYISEKAWELIKDNCAILKKDLIFTERLFSDEYIIPIYKTAFIWGIKFQGRGQDYFEFQEPTNDNSYGKQFETLEYFPSNARNNWRGKHFPKLNSKDVSSLCLVKNEDIDRLHFCQINAFSKIDDMMEPLLSNTTFAIVITRDCNNVNQLGPQDRAFPNLYKSNLTYDHMLSIVKLKYIYPCPLAIVHMDENKAPINPNDDKTRTKSLLFFLLNRNRAMLIDNESINNNLLKYQEPNHA